MSEGVEKSSHSSRLFRRGGASGPAQSTVCVPDIGRASLLVGVSVARVPSLRRGHFDRTCVGACFGRGVCVCEQREERERE